MKKTQLHNYFDKNNTTKSHARNWVFKFKGFLKFSNLNNEVPEMCFRLPAQAASDYPHKVPSNNGVYKKLFPTSNCPNTCTANPPEQIVS